MKELNGKNWLISKMKNGRKKENMGKLVETK